MNEIQILNDYNIFVVLGSLLSCLWMGAYILSWIIQWAWAWVDEAKVGSYNYVVRLLEKRGNRNGWYKNTTYKESPNSAYQFFHFENGVIVEESDTESPKREIIAEEVFGTGSKVTIENLPRYVFILPLIWFSMLCLNFWWISMWFALAFGVAYTMRMARRGQKMLASHMADKTAHGREEQK